MSWIGTNKTYIRSRVIEGFVHLGPVETVYSDLELFLLLVL